MLSIARKTALSGSVARIAQRTILKPMTVLPTQRRQYSAGSATAEKVNIKTDYLDLKGNDILMGL